MKFIKKLLLLMLLVILVIGAFYTYRGYSLYKNAVESVALETKVESIRQEKDYVVIDNLPKEYLDAVVSVEDHRFYTHKGIDYIAVIRAIVNNIKEKELVEGGSTITQQLAKNMYFTQKKELERKIAEMFLTVDLENEYKKEEILELYVNTSYFGDGYYGIGQASKGYFNKKPINMTLYESTLLAGVPNAPSIYAPTKNPDLASKRQKIVIQKMVEYGTLSKDEADELLKKIK